MDMKHRVTFPGSYGGPGQSRTADQRFRKCWQGPPSQSYQALARWIQLSQSGEITPFGS